MSIQELETAIKKLSTRELASLTSWLIGKESGKKSTKAPERVK